MGAVTSDRVARRAEEERLRLTPPGPKELYRLDAPFGQRVRPQIVTAGIEADEAEFAAVIAGDLAALHQCLAVVE